MAIHAESKNIDLKGMKIQVEKKMLDSPRRIGSLNVILELPSFLSERERKSLENAAHQCPVHKSLHPDIKIDLIFKYI